MKNLIITIAFCFTACLLHAQDVEITGKWNSIPPTLLNPDSAKANLPLLGKDSCNGNVFEIRQDFSGQAYVHLSATPQIVPTLTGKWTQGFDLISYDASHKCVFIVPKANVSIAMAGFIKIVKTLICQ